MQSRYLQQCLTFTPSMTVATMDRFSKILPEIWRCMTLTVPEESKQNSTKKTTFQSQKYEYDVWLLYSGAESLKWVTDILKPGVEEQCNKRIALDIYCETPGKYMSDNYREMAEKSEKVSIVLRSESDENEWFRYQIELALKRDPENILVCHLDQTSWKHSKFKCLAPIQTIQFFDQIHWVSMAKIENFLKKEGH